jgi:hypothetical protein
VNTYQKARRALCQQTPAADAEKAAQFVTLSRDWRPDQESTVC